MMNTCRNCKHFNQFGPKASWLRDEESMGTWAELGKCEKHDKVEIRTDVCDDWEEEG